MSERAHSLANRFEWTNEGLIAFAEGLSDTQWRLFCPPEGRAVGVVVYHIAEGHALFTEVARAVVMEEPLPLGLVQSREEAERKNARQAAEHCDCTREETVALLQRNGAAAVGLVRQLTDEQLSQVRFVWGQEGSADQLIEHVMIGHLQGHFATLQGWLENEASRP